MEEPAGALAAELKLVARALSPYGRARMWNSPAITVSGTFAGDPSSSVTVYPNLPSVPSTLAAASRLCTSQQIRVLRCASTLAAPSNTRPSSPSTSIFRKSGTG